jgi:hypothetical protein
MNMKKTYMNPTLEVVVLKLNQSILTNSLGVDESKQIQNTGDLLGRDFDFDEDEY